MLLIVSRPAGMVGEAKQVARASLAQHSRHTWIKARRIAKASPDVIPFAAAMKQRVGRPLNSVLVRIETEFTPTNIFEGRPTIWIAASFESIVVAHPAEQISHWITDGQSVEIVSLQSASTKASECLGRQQCGNAARSIASRVRLSLREISSPTPSCPRMLGRHPRSNPDRCVDAKPRPGIGAR